MLLANARRGAFHKFTDIQFVDGYWYAWYYVELTNQDIESMSEGDGDG